MTLNRNRSAAGTVDASQVALFYSINSSEEMSGIVSDFLAVWDARQKNTASGVPSHPDKRVFFGIESESVNGYQARQYFVGEFGVDGLSFETETWEMLSPGVPRQKQEKYENVGIHGVFPLQGGRSEQGIEIRLHKSKLAKFSARGGTPLNASLQVWRKEENGKWEPVSRLCKFEFPD